MRQPRGLSLHGRGSCRLSGSWALTLRVGVGGLPLLCGDCTNSVGIEGRTVAIEYRWSEGRPERVAEVTAEFVRQKVDVIVTMGGAVAAFKQATPDIPIVFAIAIDPVGGGLVANLSRPGGNVTGLSLQLTDSAGKRLELLREAVPSLRRLAILFDAGYPASLKESSEAQATARAMGLEIAPLGIRRTDDIAPAFEALKVDALYVVDNALVTANRTLIITLAVGMRLATVFSGREFVKAGGLLLMDQTTELFFCALPITLTRYYAGQSPAIFRSSNRPDSSLSSTSRPPMGFA